MKWHETCKIEDSRGSRGLGVRVSGEYVWSMQGMGEMPGQTFYDLCCRFQVLPKFQLSLLSPQSEHFIVAIISLHRAPYKMKTWDKYFFSKGWVLHMLKQWSSWLYKYELTPGDSISPKSPMTLGNIWSNILMQKRWLIQVTDPHAPGELQLAWVC